MRIRLHPAPIFLLSLAPLLFFGLTACQEPTGGDTPTDTAPEISQDGDTQPADGLNPEDDATDSEGATPTCTPLFGRPNAQTGLSSDLCSPSCGCGDTVFEAPDYDSAFTDALRQWTHNTPFEAPEDDPYEEENPAPIPEGTVCGVLPDAGEGPRGYDLKTYASKAEAEAEGAIITHEGICGYCSTLDNLAVYIDQNDLTDPVRQCGFKDFAADGQEAAISCLRDLGFDQPCAVIWYYNTRNTRQSCLNTCLALLEAPYHNEDGSLNDCLLCDERESGPVFKHFAGRTRRNSGLANSMCRPCEEVDILYHDYDAQPGH